MFQTRANGRYSARPWAQRVTRQEQIGTAGFSQFAAKTHVVRHQLCQRLASRCTLTIMKEV